MGIEYFLVKPEKRETFYLGKHFNGIEGVPNGRRNKKGFSISDACGDWEDFFWTIFKNNLDYFRSIEGATFSQLEDIIYDIYVWCGDDIVYVDDDCHDDAEWLNWNETGSIDRSINMALEKRTISYFVNDRDSAATSLFDGDVQKGKLLLGIIDASVAPINVPEFKEVKMELPEDSCKYCTPDGECLYYMPDSMFECKGKCDSYKGYI